MYTYLVPHSYIEYKIAVISIYRNNTIGFFKLVHIIGWSNDKTYFVNSNICILEGIYGIQNTGSDMMHRR